MAEKCGADVVLNPSHCDVVEEVRSLTGGYGCDIIIHRGHWSPPECPTGVRDLYHRGVGGKGLGYVDLCEWNALWEIIHLPRLLMLCKMGTLVQYGVFGQETTVDWTIISDAKGIIIIIMSGPECFVVCYCRVLCQLSAFSL